MKAAFALLLLLTGCATGEAAGGWVPTQASNANLAAEVANPADLVRGERMTGGDGARAASAIQRLREDKLKPLPDINTTNTGSGNGGH